MEAIASFFARIPALIAGGQAYVVLFPVYVALLGGERIVHELTQRRKWDDKDGAANLVITGAYMVRDLLVAGVIPMAAFWFLYENARLFTLPDGGFAWLFAFVLYDFIWYVEHRMGHRMGFFWAIHSVHHSSREYNMTVASRGCLLDYIVGRPFIYVIPILGVTPTMYLTVAVLTNIWGIAQHTRLVPKLGVLDRLFATPSSHRVHHGSNLAYLDRNYGEILMVWDHLFGTYTPETEAPVYGMLKNIDTYNPVKIEIAGFQWLWSQMKTADTLWNALRYLWMPPGWRHDGTGATTEQLIAARG